MRSAFLGATVAALLLAPAVREADAQTQTCQNTISLSGNQTTTYTITAKGVYCLTKDVIMASGVTLLAAVEIDADHVVFDLNGHRIGANSASVSAGVRSIAHKDVTVKNGTVRGFPTGIFISDGGDPADARGVLVEGIQAEANTGMGICATGEGLLIRDNRVLATGDGSQAGIGILASGPGARVVNNLVVNTSGSAELQATGIDLDAAPGGVVEGNQVTNETVPSGGSSAAIRINNATNALVVGNRVAAWTFGISANTGSGARCRDNFFAGVTTLLSGCTDVGNNN